MGVCPVWCRAGTEAVHLWRMEPPGAVFSAVTSLSAEAGQRLVLPHSMALGWKHREPLQQWAAVMPTVKQTEAVTAAHRSHRYRAFRDQANNLTLTYWQVLAIRLGFITMFKVPAADALQGTQSIVLHLSPQPTCVHTCFLACGFLYWMCACKAGTWHCWVHEGQGEAWIAEPGHGGTGWEQGGLQQLNHLLL